MEKLVLFSYVVSMLQVLLSSHIHLFLTQAHLFTHILFLSLSLSLAGEIYRAELSEDELLNGIQGQKRWEAEAHSSFLQDKRELVSVQQQVVDSNYL